MDQPKSTRAPPAAQAADEPYDLAISGGTVVLPQGPVAANIGVRNGLIAHIGAGDLRARTVIDAAGRLVLPGGVDSHCHMDQQPWEGRSTADDFRSGTLSALCGGNTTVLPFAMQMRGQSLRRIVDDYHERARPKAHIDYGFHLIVGDPTSEVLSKELPELIEQGCTSIKIYLTYEGLKLDDYEVLNDPRIRAPRRRHGNGACRERRLHPLADRSAAGERERPRFATTSLRTPISASAKPLSGPSASRSSSRRPSSSYMYRLPAWSRRCVAHRQRGLPIYAETCPQYLFLSSEDIDTADYERRQMRLHAAAPRPRQSAANVARPVGRHARGVLLGPLAMELCGQDRRRTEHAVQAMF